jgi:hypothetical protein
MSGKKKTVRKTPKGKKITTFYSDEVELVEFRRRADGLGISLSHYFALLARADIRGDGSPPALLPPLRPPKQGDEGK